MYGLDYYGASHPVKDVSNEFFDLQPQHHKTLAASMGSVSGDGIAAAFSISSLHACLRGLNRNRRGSLAPLVRELNRTMYEVSSDNTFACLFHAEIDGERGQLRYVTAGYQPALLVRHRTSQIHWLESSGAVLGLSPRSEYRERSVELEPGDLLVVLSDGVADTLDDAAVADILKHNRHSRPADVVPEIIEAAGSTEDRTVFAVRFNGLNERCIFSAA